MRNGTETPTFKQTIAILRDVTRRYPTLDYPSLVEMGKRQHLALGFSYTGAQIHKAIAALDHVKRQSPTSPRSDPST